MIPSMAVGLCKNANKLVSDTTSYHKNRLTKISVPRIIRKEEVTHGEPISCISQNNWVYILESDDWCLIH